jgi:hypothetical protein
VTSRILENAQREIERGNLWRAKEILQGAIGGEKSFDVALFEMMGTVLLRMGDLPEAGRFLFLSGVRKPEYLESIEIFLSRHRRKHPRDFVAHLPRNARLGSLSDYPDDVARVLREIGFPENMKDQNARALPQTGKEMIFWIACGTIALVTLVLIILGAMKLLEIIKT